MTRTDGFRLLCTLLGATFVLLGGALFSAFFRFHMPDSDLSIPAGRTGFYFVGFSGCALIVWGGCPAIIRVSHAHDANDAIENSRLEIFEAAGHYPHCEEPERFAELLTDFIESTAAARYCEQRWGDLLRTGQRTTPRAAAGTAIA